MRYLETVKADLRRLARRKSVGRGETRGHSRKGLSPTSSFRLETHGHQNVQISKEYCVPPQAMDMLDHILNTRMKLLGALALRVFCGSCASILPRFPQFYLILLNLTPGDGHIATGEAKYTLGLLKLFAGDEDAAREAVAAACATYVKHLGPDHPSTIDIQNVKVLRRHQSKIRLRPVEMVGREPTDFSKLNCRTFPNGHGPGRPPEPDPLASKLANYSPKAPLSHARTRTDSKSIKTTASSKTPYSRWPCAPKGCLQRRSPIIKDPAFISQNIRPDFLSPRPQKQLLLERVKEPRTPFWKSTCYASGAIGTRVNWGEEPRYPYLKHLYDTHVRAGPSGSEFLHRLPGCPKVPETGGVPW
jgi:hypothetical protein